MRSRSAVGGAHSIFSDLFRATLQNQASLVLFTASHRVSILVRTILLLTISNVFMTFAWYAHLRNLHSKPWIVAALLSWGLALFEYLFQVPANRIGYTQYSLGQLKILQEVITLSVFAPFAVFYMQQPLKLDFLWAALCMVGAVYFMFRS
jgi:uncharacterized protein